VRVRDVLQHFCAQDPRERFILEGHVFYITQDAFVVWETSLKDFDIARIDVEAD
jgi:hypothetical protein